MSYVPRRHVLRSAKLPCLITCFVALSYVLFCPLFLCSIASYCLMFHCVVLSYVPLCRIDLRYVLSLFRMSYFVTLSYES